jgi:hypothetical protein
MNLRIWSLVSRYTEAVIYACVFTMLQLMILYKGKANKRAKHRAVPLHVMEALGGRGGIAPTHSRPRH